MTREQIEQWASQAGWRVDTYTNSKERLLVGLTPSSVEQVERFVALVAAHEREQCALSVEAMTPKCPDLEEYEDSGAYLVWGPSDAYDDRWVDQPTTAAAIRARGELSQIIRD